jgi:hypothetical protein
MESFNQTLRSAGIICFGIALFQVVIGFSPSLSLYFGAPEVLVKNIYALIFISFVVAGILTIFGFYALSGAGYIRRLPLLKQMLVVISCVYILRGLLLVPEILVVTGAFDSAIPVAPRFVIFSIGSLLTGVIFVAGTVGGWNALSLTDKNVVQ